MTKVHSQFIPVIDCALLDMITFSLRLYAKRPQAVGGRPHRDVQFVVTTREILFPKVFRYRSTRAGVNAPPPPPRRCERRARARAARIPTGPR
ncbi:hypothetical protein EVAR_98239_1 [Eumeta japonica]|uniref:Uncharacterized protein n=1 Tax=Eumeta variegata TaxID=151549 RepID=A0A4C1XZX5_EUMVA|nr:hypothetical protein EVAR_98239_1 [Eumeta japonica]